MNDEQSYIVAPKSGAVSVDEMVKTLQQIAASVPGFKHGPPHPSTGVAVVTIPRDAVESVSQALGDRFILEVNAALRY